jgi:hypothetical protein
METLTKLEVVKIKREVQDIISELNVALSFLSEARETSDKQHQRQLIRYAQIVHQAVLRLLPSLPLAGLDQTRIAIGLLQIRAGLKSHGISVSRTLQETVVKQGNRSEKTPYLN